MQGDHKRGKITDTAKLFHLMADAGDSQRRINAMKRQLAKNKRAEMERDLLLLLIGIELGYGNDPRFHNLFKKFK